MKFSINAVSFAVVLSQSNFAMWWYKRVRIINSPIVYQKLHIKWAQQFLLKKKHFRDVVVVQLVARLIPIPEDPGSNPVIDKFYKTIIYCL